MWAQQAPPHLEPLARLWGAARAMHPWLETRDPGLEAAFVAALEAEARGGTDAATAFAASLGDPLTDVAPKRVWIRPEGPRVTSLPEGGLYLDLVRVGLANYQAFLESALPAIPKAKVVVLDLRPGPGAPEPEVAAVLLKVLAPAFTDRPLRTESLRRRMQGFLPAESGRFLQEPFTGGFQETQETIAPEGTTGGPVLSVLIPAGDPVPPVLAALRAAGRARIVVAGGTTWSTGETRRIPLGDGREAALRIAGSTAPHAADAQVEGVFQAGPESPGVAIARQAALRPAAAWTEGPACAPAWAPQPAETRKAAYPAPALRALAIAKLWATLRYHYPYLKAEAWEAGLSPALAEAFQAPDALAFQRAVSRLAVRIEDSHTWIEGAAALDREVAGVPAGVDVRMIEGQPLVARPWSEGAKAAGLHPGDRIVAVDGEPAETRLARITATLAASTPQARDRNAAAQLLSGPEGRPAKVEVEGLDGVRRMAELPRARALWAAPPHRSGPVATLLDGAVGYLDLDRLELADVDGALARVKGAKALILDMRGYPRQTFERLASRLNVRGAKAGAILRVPLVFPKPGQEATELVTPQAIPTSGEPAFRGPMALLIDERTQSQAEHLGLFLEAAAGVTFIGSPSAGADGDVSDVVLPGGLTVTYTGMGVLHSNGRPLQRVGLQPSIEVHPTRKGLAEGRDEVLEAAIRWGRSR